MINWVVNGATVSVGVQRKEIDARLFRAYLYRRFAEHDPDLRGAVGQTIQFTNYWAPAAPVAGITDVPNLTLRDPIMAARTIQLLTYGEAREWSTSVVKRAPAKVEKVIREELPDSVARSINLACYTQFALANTIYTPTGTIAAPTRATVWNGALPGGAYARPITNWDLATLAGEAGQLGMRRHPTFGWNLIVEHINYAQILRSLQTFALAGPPESLTKALAEWDPGKYFGWLHGVTLWYDNSSDCLSSARVGAGGGPFGEAYFFGANPLIEAAVNKGMEVGPEVNDYGRKLRLGMYEEDEGWTLQVNDAGTAIARPATIGSTAMIRIDGT
jgi:hypothetical protein